MKAFIIKNAYFLITVVLFALSELIVNPRGEFPLNDDWSYTKSLLLLHETGKFTVGEFAAMTLFTHVMWGELFVRIFGFSFFILRFSTFISALTGVYFLQRMISSSTGKPVLGFLAGLTLLFNPVYFNVTNTFLTDISFNTLVILCCYCAWMFFNTHNAWWYALAFVFSLLLVLVRQFGLIVPFCLAFSSMFLAKRRTIFIFAGITGTILVIVVFKLYEVYLKSFLSPGSAYVYSGTVALGDPKEWERMLLNFLYRFNVSWMHILIFSFPFVVMFLPSLLWSFKIKVIAGILLICALCDYFFFIGAVFPHHNIFLNMSLGPDTFYESVTSGIIHTYSRTFGKIATALKFILCGAGMLILALLAIRNKDKLKVIWSDPQSIFAVSLFTGYLLILYTANSFFDRYHLPLLSVGLILFSGAAKHLPFDYRWFIIPMAFYYYVAVAGTRDYMTMNRTKWEAYDYIHYKQKVPLQKINGGFEINNWNDGKHLWWADFTHLDFDYLIQYSEEKDFRKLKAFPFRRFFPYRMDTIFLFERTAPGIPAVAAEQKQ